MIRPHKPTGKREGRAEAEIVVASGHVLAAHPGDVGQHEAGAWSGWHRHLAGENRSTRQMRRHCVRGQQGRRQGKELHRCSSSARGKELLST